MWFALTGEGLRCARVAGWNQGTLGKVTKRPGRPPLRGGS
jgi:hypothetical protein